MPLGPMANLKGSRQLQRSPTTALKGKSVPATTLMGRSSPIYPQFGDSKHPATTAIGTVTPSGPHPLAIQERDGGTRAFYSAAPNQQHDPDH